jgi:ATP-dependent DNA helicase RecG
MAERAGVSEKTISRKIKDMDHITFIGKGDNGYWEIKEQGD